MTQQFVDLPVQSVERLCKDAVAVTFALPDAGFTSRPGQYLTLQAKIGGENLRRPYSIASAPNGKTATVGIRATDGGRFSTWAQSLKAGDKVAVAPPEGRFVPPEDAQDVLLIAAGSGITPILAIATSLLETSASARVTLIYGNRVTESIMFREALEALKDRFLSRLRLIHVLSREAQDVELFDGRIDGDKLRAMMSAGLVYPAQADAIMLCGPAAMGGELRPVLTEAGVDESRIHQEVFTPAADAPAPSRTAVDAAKSGVQIEVLLDGVKRQFNLKDGTILEAAEGAGLDLPYSCRGGMCCTCRCKVTEGTAEMDVNYSLEPWELEAGFILACQARPTSGNLTLDFDAS